MLLKQGYENFKGYFHKIEEIPESDKIPIKTITTTEFVKLAGVTVIDLREKDDTTVRLKNSMNVK